MKKWMCLALCLALSTSVFASRKELAKAVEAGKLAEVQKLLDADVDPNRDYRDTLPLVKAIQLGHREIADALIAKGADVNGVQDDGETPLLAALNHLDEAWVKALLEKGAKVDLEKGSATPLYRAGELQDITLFELLRGAGATLDQTSVDEETPLFAVIRSGALGMTQHVIRLGANVNHVNKHGETPFLIAVQEGDIPMTKLLLQSGADKTAKDKTEKNGLTWAALSGDQAMVALLYGLGVDPEVSDFLGNNAIGYIQYFNAKAKLDAVKDPLASMGDAFQQAVMLNDLNSLKEQVKEGFDFAARDCPTVCSDKNIEKFPVIFTLRYGSIETIKHIFDSGAPVNGHKDNLETTPINEASRLGRIDLVRFLIARGAEPDKCSKWNLTPLAVAVKNGQRRIAKTLWEGRSRVYGNGASGEVLRFEDGDFNFDALVKQHHVLKDKLPDPNSDQGPVCLPQDDIYDVECDDVKAPVFTKKVPPKYPRGIRNKPPNDETYVVLSAVLGKDGKARDIRVLRPVQNYRFGYEFSSVEAFKQWEFEPGTRNGKPVDVRMTLKISFVWESR